jgi:hypothetical protein
MHNPACFSLDEKFTERKNKSAERYGIHTSRGSQVLIQSTITPINEAKTLCDDLHHCDPALTTLNIFSHFMRSH